MVNWITMPLALLVAGWIVFAGLTSNWFKRQQ